MKQKLSIAGNIATLGGLGFFSSMPGTVGSGAAFLFYVFLPVPLLGIIAVMLLGIWAADVYAKETQQNDPKEVVIDEVIGTWISMFCLPRGFWLPALFLFRIVDIIKPIPVSTAEKFPGGLGIMADDVVGGIITNLILWGIHWLYYGGGFQLLLGR
ncbi:MAG: phosphatidylglycerophosphatase A [Aminobacterium sp.]|jgi:phosphatidylglycerophosphatase A|uniref:phosphatidylglycerophosphatase A family protein n=1 Tax=unclassified Aminobacterium TaxID=2685012 RepID=UPI001BCF6125|nr:MULTISPECIES: phosphatidylglycerophosphatase A [unclassified Aminobacterium]MDD2206477.1 phosphatidylglycerophosphatase A [Aminobacterium sp.]MDD3426455.1 phosphatidylglycerophosphatase A [Aminobacterium sp.]MDD3706968.1 phosphatidylglycerophosphatase A [Aminobacterium sp.]MDD4228188.1 phosphatidylglycerophosphatase A [Aminobacterium sp.]MDD4551225.1 phosphatidylglycerophosphatase A [Aminobacterium sp.]